MSTIPYARQDISQADIDAVEAVLRSDWLTQGPVIERFEHAVGQRCEAKYASATTSATAALHLACLALGLGKGDLLWTSPNTFVASANCARYCGADVDFVDINPQTLNMCASALEAKLIRAKKTGRLPKIVIPVHFAGQPCDMAAIGALASQYGFAVVEDASHAVGAEYGPKPVGACTHSSITVFSFHPVKILTTGEGGMLLTNQTDLDRKIKLLRSHGTTRDPAAMESPPDGPWYYQQIDLGFNYRITDIQAALGLSQLSRLDVFIARRRHLAARYERLLGDVPIELPTVREGVASSWHLYVVRVPGSGRAAVFSGLQKAGIRANVHYIPVHLQPYYRRLGFKPGDFPEAERYYAEGISLPMYVGLSDADQERISTELRQLLT